MLKKIKERMKQLLLSVLSMTTAGSGFASIMVRPVQADTVVSTLRIEHYEMPFYYKIQYAGDGTWHGYNQNKQIPLYGMDTTGDGKANMIVFCIQNGAALVSSDKDAQTEADAGNLTYNQKDTTDYFKSLSAEAQLKIEWAGVWFYYEGEYSDRARRAATQMYIWNIANKEKWTYDDDTKKAILSSGYIDWDGMEKQAKENGTKSLDNYKEAKAYYEELETYVNYWSTDAHKLAFDEDDGATINLKPGETHTIRDTHKVFHNDMYIIANEHPAEGVTVMKDPNNKDNLLIKIAEDCNEIPNINITIKYNHNISNGRIWLFSSDRKVTGSSGAYNYGTSQELIYPHGIPDPDGFSIKLKMSVGNIQVKKTDSKTGSVLANTKFELRKAGEDEVLATRTTNAQGIAEFTNLNYGDYTVKEIGAPAGYNISVPNTKPVTLNSSSVTVEFTDEPIEGKIKLIKKSNKVATKTLAGAVFEVHRISDIKGPITDTVVGTLTTGTDGTVSSGELEYGSYYVVETIPPKGYTLNSTHYPFAITEEAVVIEQEIKNDPINGKVKVYKYDKNNKARPLAGAVFEIHKTADIDGPITDTVVGTLTTGADGTAISNDLEYGEYYLVETIPPVGYNLDTTHYPFAITEDAVIIEKEIKNDPINGKVKIYKYDEYNKTKPLANAVFEIHKTANINGPIADIVVGTLTTNAKGEAVSEDLEYGSYYLVETKAPTGYNLHTEHYDFAVREQDVVIEETAYDKPIEGKVEITKYSSRVIVKKLAGAVFEIHRVANIEGPITDTVVGTLTTGTDGKAISGNLEYGDYYLVEIIPPEGYNLNDEHYEFSIRKECTTEKKTATDKPIDGHVKVAKYDAYHNPLRLSEAEFAIYKTKDIDGNVVNNEYIETIITGEDGYAISSALEYGDYYLIETKAPKGYVKDKNKHPFSIEQEETEVIINVDDKPIEGRVEILKVDKDYPDAKLEGAVFEIHRLSNMQGPIEDTLIGEITTDENGVATSELLEYGDYYLIEKTAPYGYFNDRTKYPFSIVSEDDFKTVKKIATNGQTTSLVRIIKVDSNKDGKGIDENGNKLKLEGAEFELWEHVILRDALGHILNETDALIAGPVTTDENGEALFDNRLAYSNELQQSGSYYYVKEVKAPEGYKLNIEEHRIDLVYQGQDIPVIEIESIFEDDYIPAKIKVIKRDKENNEIRLAGAIFEVKNSKDVIVDTIATNENGEASTKNLRPGTYTVTEIKAPDNYQKDSKPQTVTLKSSIQDGEVVVLDKTVLFENTHNKATLSITKVDNVHLDREYICKDETNEETCEEVINVNDRTIFLPNVEFAIYSQDDISKIVTTGVTDENGKISFTLDTGSYYYQEIKAPEGYNINPKLVPFELTKHGETKEELAINSVILGSLKVYKIGEMLVGKQVNKDGTTELIWKDSFMPNARFEVYAEKDIVHPILEKVLYEKDEFITELITDKNGQASITNLPLGSYYVKEITAPEEHSVHDITSNIKYITLSEEESNFDGVVESETTFVNERLIIDPAIYKVGAKLNDINDETKGRYNIPLEGVVFGIYNSEDIAIKATDEVVGKDTLLAKMTTNQDGTADVQTKLPFGKYYLKEISTIDGYYLDETKYDFELVWSQDLQENKVLVVEVSDKENPIINYEIPMPKTGIKIAPIYVLITVSIIGGSVLAISLKKKKD